jgi:hypothetical protein
MSTDFVKQTMRENLGRVLIPHVADGLWSIYDNAKTACERNDQPEKTLQTFQNLLTRIPQWPEDTLRKEVDRISVASKCDYIEDLLLGVFVSYIRAFASLQQAETTHVNIEFDRPSLSKFIHAFYNASARKSWSNAYLFKTIGVSSEQQARNRRDIETLLEATMSEVVDSFIPWRDISKAYFQAREDATPAARASAPPASKPVTFGTSEVKEFETDDEDDDTDTDYDSEEEERPRMTTGEDTKLDFDDDSGAESDDTEAELEKKAKGETVSMNL